MVTKKEWIIIVSSIIIISIAIFFIKRINSGIGLNAKFELEKRIDNDLMNNYHFESLDDYNINDLIKIEYDSNNIVNVKYDVDNSNKLIDTNLKNINKMHENSYIILNVPIGSILNDYFFSTFGPKIPIRIKYNKKIYVNLVTKIRDYGMNSSLVELYVIVTIDYLIQNTNISINKTYDFLIASSLIVGSVHNTYGTKYDYPYNNYTEKNER